MGVKTHCPVCANPDVFRLDDGRLGCENGHAFNACEALVAVGDAIVLAKAFNHPTRRKIIFAYGEKDRWSARELTEHLGVSTPHHVKALREAEPPILIEAGSEKKRGATEVFYRVNPELLDAHRGSAKGRPRSD